MATFDELFEDIIVQEGTGLTDDPDDRGGLTKFGLSKESNPDLDIENLTLEEAKEIYKDRYWNEFRIGDMPEALRPSIFRHVVNSGAAFILDLQRELGVSVDGVVGSETLGALKKSEGNTLPEVIFDNQLNRYINLVKTSDKKLKEAKTPEEKAKVEDQRTFLNGWMNRVIGAQPGEIFSKNKVDLRGLKPSEIKTRVAQAYQKINPTVTEEPLEENLPSPATLAMVPRQTSVEQRTLESAVNPAASDASSDEFIARLYEGLGKMLNAPQRGSQAPSEAPSEADTQAEPEEDEVQPLVRQLADQIKSKKSEKKPKPASESGPRETNPVKNDMVRRLSKTDLIKSRIREESRATGTTETEEPVRVSNEGGQDGSKDPIFGIF